MWRIAKAIESLKEKQMDLMDMPSLPKEFILKSVSDSNLHPNLVTHFYPKSPISEQYRKLRENFKSLNKEKAIKVFSITSSIANEGKSITALNLAVSLTHDVDCKNVLLIDSDLRRGNIDGMLGMLPQVGLSEYLLLGADIENILFKSKINKLTIIPRGKIVENPTELLASSKMDSLLKMVREKFICREVGNLVNLENMVNQYPIKGKVGIGHTRWATHGEPTHNNAHPHTDCNDEIIVVHNGIIENYLPLKNKLKRGGHTFRSDTDTEVLAHLIEEYQKTGAQTLEEAILCALMDIKGTYAIAVISKKDPGKLVAARNGSPLILGIGENEIFIASDAPAIIPYTRKVVFLEDYQVAVVKDGKFNITGLNGTSVMYNISTIDWDVRAAQKDGYEHFMLKEIHEQPKIVKNILAEKIDFRNFDLKIEELLKIKSQILKAHQVIIQACGTSYHAGMIGEIAFEYFTNLHTDVEVSSEFRYKHFIADPNTLVISISQSGETADTLIALRKAKNKGLATFSLCNVVGSSVARESSAVFYIHAGPEIGVASTKAYIAQLFSLYLVAIFLGTLKKIIKDSFKNNLVKELSFIPSLMNKVLGSENLIAYCAEKYHSYNDFYFLGRGINYASALEGALKLKEIAYIHASAYPSGEMKHGPIALVSEKLVTVCIAVKSVTYDKVISNSQEIKARKGKVIAIASEGDMQIKKYVDDVIYIPQVQEIFSPLLVALPLQLLAYYIAVKRGCSVDKPKNLAKSVTVE
ncbi:MAG: glutamine--fructose-6-phosphate transaminase (isomerizing) [Candidatus Omnitrophica bacterium]|nr:glutamine--fructose-6-phosphate transaminase (isomerizing) [Candidatus Omnitrophota bacterium]